MSFLSLYKDLQRRWQVTQQYTSTFSRRSLCLFFFFMSILVFCFISSSFALFGYDEKSDYFIYARNDTHLLSNHRFDYGEKPYVSSLDEKAVFEACLDPGKVPEYYLSIVVVTRNDNYATNQYERLQNMIDSTFLMAEETKTRMELLLIEWNPVPDKRSIIDTYRFRRSDYLTYRILTVPNEIHSSFQYKNNKHVYEFEGKNLGIRYARGEFIVCITQDDIWSQHMYEAVRTRYWNRKTVYVQFQDIHSDLEIDVKEKSSLVHLEPFPTDQQIQASCNHTLSTLNKSNKEEDEQEVVILTQDNYLMIGHESSDFTLAHHTIWTKVGGYREIGATLWMDVEFLLNAYHQFGYAIRYSKRPYNCHQTHPNQYHEGQESDNHGVQVDAIFSKSVTYANSIHGLHWGLSQIQATLFERGLKCSVFRGGLGK